MPSTITSLTILNGTVLPDGADAADPNGWVARVELPDNDGGGNLNQTFDPTKIVLTVQDPGFSAAGVATTQTRTIRGGEIIRRQYPNQAQRLNSESAGVRTIYFSLREPVFAGSTITAANAEAGYYGSAVSGSIDTRVNSSARPYRKPLACWASLQHERRTASFYAELVPTHEMGRNGQMVAGVRFSAADEAAGATGNIDVNSPVPSQEQTQGPVFEVFRGLIPLTNMAQGNRCILNAKVYPWIGDAGAVLDLAVDGAFTTGDWSNNQPKTTLRFICDKTGGYGGAIACVKSGAVGGTVQATLAAARGTPFPTITAAMTAISTWNNANKGHADIGGSDIYLVNDTGAAIGYSLASITAAGGKTWCNIRQDPLNTAEAFIAQTAETGPPAYLRIMVRIAHTAGNGIAQRGALKPVCLESMTLDYTGSSTTANINWRSPFYFFRNVTLKNLHNTLANPLYGPGSNTTESAVSQAMGLVWETPVVNSKAQGMFSLLGCRMIRVQFSDQDRAVYTLLHPFVGIQWVSTEWLNITDVAASNIGSNNVIEGFHAVGILIEQTSNGGGGGFRLGGDSAVKTMDDVLIAYASIPGSGATNPSNSRMNYGYADVAGAVGVYKRIQVKFGVFHQGNIKTDTFTTNTTVSGRTKNWEPRYQVGFRGNVWIEETAQGAGADSSGGNWQGEFLDPASVANPGVASVTFVDNKAGQNAAGFGNYRLTGVSNSAYNRVPAGEGMVKYDLDGRVRLQDGTGAAGPYERELPEIGGTQNGVEGNDASIASATLTITGTAANVEAADTIAIEGESTSGLSATLARSEAGDTVTSAGALVNGAGFNRTEGADVIFAAAALSGAESPNGATLTRTEANDAVQAAAVMPLGAALVKAEDADTVTAAGGAAIAGSVAVSEGSDTTLTSSSLPATGFQAGVEQPDGLTAIGLLPVGGVAALTEQSDGWALQAVIPAHGALQLTEAGDAMTAGAQLLNGAAALIVEGADYLTADTESQARAAVAATEADDALSAGAGLIITTVDLIDEASDMLSGFGSLVPVGGFHAEAALVEGDDEVLGLVISAVPGRFARLLKTGRAGISVFRDRF